ncbi:MAG TPA: phytoene/squalene synthase family protein [Acidobacteriaceae bacterium]|nr:phytoene/squalene synthase family protein [Acidobacteriaceae bacterium]
MTPPPSSSQDPQLQAAYRTCTEIARREAKNFYYAFLALPKPKRDAICAVYAFMRHADDLSDDESRSRDQRRVDLAAWLDAWHQAAAGQAADDPVFLALNDARLRFSIPLELLDQLVQGTAMDLEIQAGNAAYAEARSPGSFFTYATFEDLRRYCYFVASVVGLVCIRIFGYSDPRAEQLAEETGIAFQLTNILRDVKEDAARGRIYLPVEDLDRYSVRIEDLAALRDGSGVTLDQRELLAGVAKRAEDYYQSGFHLLPLVSPDARPALWVLITIYHRLLGRIERRNFDVFTERITVSLTARLSILFRGLLQVLRYRLFGSAPRHA